MNFLIDNNLPPQIGRALNILSKKEGHLVVPLRDKFEATTEDTIWLGALGQEGNWAVLTEDTRISKNKHERRAWLEAGVTIFFLQKSWNNIKYWEKISKLVLWWPRIMQQAESVQAGTGFLVPFKGQKFEVMKGTK